MELNTNFYKSPNTFDTDTNEAFLYALEDISIEHNKGMIDQWVELSELETLFNNYLN